MMVTPSDFTFLTPEDMENPDATDYIAPPAEETETVSATNDMQRVSSQNPVEEVFPSCDPIVGKSRIARNKPCPCGSGKKYKHCCGEE